MSEIVSVSIDIKGLKQLRQAMSNFSDEVGNKVIKKSIRAGLEVIRKQASRNAPVGKTGNLSKGIVIKQSKINNGKRGKPVGMYLDLFRTRGGRKDPKDVFYGQFVEDGYNTRGKRGTRAQVRKDFGGRTGRKSRKGKTNVQGKRFVHYGFVHKRIAAVNETVNVANKEIEVLKRKVGL